MTEVSVSIDNVGVAPAATADDATSTLKQMPADSDSSRDSSVVKDGDEDDTRALTVKESDSTGWRKLRFWPHSGMDAEKKIRRWQEMWFGSVYFAAGMTNATKVLLPLYLADRGLSEFSIGVVVGLDDIGLVSKIPAGIITDKFDLFGYGHRRPYVFLFMWITALAYFFRAVLDVVGFNYGGFVALIVLDSIIREFFDKPTDAYANESTPRNSVGRIQGMVMNGMRGLAVVMGFGIGTIASDAGRFGWAFKFLFDAIVLAVASFMVFKVPRVKVTNPFQWRAFAELKRRNLAFHAVFMFIGGIPTNIMLTAAPLFIRDATDGNVSTGLYLALAGALVFLGAILMGSQFDKRRTQLPYVFAGAIAFAMAACLFFLLSIWTGIIQIMYLWALANGFTTGALLAMNQSLLFLEIQDDSISGSMIGIFGTISACGSLIGGILGGFLLKTIGYAPTVGVMWFLLGIEMLVLFGMFYDIDYSPDGMTVGLTDEAGGDEAGADAMSSIELQVNVDAPKEAASAPSVEDPPSYSDELDKAAPASSSSASSGGGGLGAEKAAEKRESASLSDDGVLSSACMSKHTAQEM